MEFKPLRHQDIAIKFARPKPSSGLFLDMGLGKTVSTLTVTDILLRAEIVSKPLIVGPKFVAEHTWPEEIAKWDHIKHLTYSVIAGTETERLRALRVKADLYIISVDNLVWLIFLKRFARRWPFDMVILDELSKFKSTKAKRFRAMKRILPQVRQLIGLTGTPVPNGLLDLWAQFYVLDKGKRLYPSVEKYRAHYFHPEKKLVTGAYTYGINPDCEELIYDKIKDICLSMKSVDWLKLPERQDVIREVELTPALLLAYKQFQKDKILELPEGEITAFNSTTLYNKLLQFANGAVYDNDGEGKYHVVHDAKLDALEEAVEELQGKPVIIFYQFKADVERIKARIPNVVLLKKKEHITAWNRKEIPVMLAHAASAGHGLNLQEGGNYLFWFGVGPNMEWYWQAVKRLDRQGQKHVVFNYHFLVKGTAEFKVYKSIQDKTLTQDRLMVALAA